MSRAGALQSGESPTDVDTLTPAVKSPLNPANVYCTLATPFNGIEHTVSHMSLEPAIRKNISFTYYEAGHMMYIEKKSREKLHKDVTAFITGAAKTEVAGVQ